MRNIIFLSSLITLSFMALARGELKTTQVQVLFRHGDRTPQEGELFPNDVHDLSVYEPWGLGQLINTGKMREFKIGTVLRTRYQDLLGDVYLPSAVYAVSTDYDRTKMSLQLVLAGLFPPSESEIWNTELPWMPIPTHYAPNPLDATLMGYHCQRYEEAIDEIMQLPEMQAKVAVYKNFFEFLTVKTGLNITDPFQVYDIYNNLVAQKAMNLTISEWITDEVFQQMGEVLILQYEIWSYTTDAKRLGGGQIVRKFIENMYLNRTEKNSRKMYLYSAHERTVAGYLRTQNIVKPKIPHYGTAVMLEKLEDNDGKLYIRIVLWTGVTEKLITLQVPGCEEICPVEQYLQLTREIIPSDEEADCLWEDLTVDQIRRVFDERKN